MKPRSRVRRAALVLTATAALGLSMAGTAFAAQKTIFAYLLDLDFRPQGTTYATTTGYAINAQGIGYDNLGVLNCTSRSYKNGTFSISPCGASAVTYRAFVGRAGATYCSSTADNWDGTYVSCQLPLYACPSTGGCQTVTLRAIARGGTQQ